MRRRKPLKCDGCGVTEKKVELESFFLDFCPHCYDLAQGFCSEKLSTAMRRFFKKAEQKAQEIGHGNINIEIKRNSNKRQTKKAETIAKRAWVRLTGEGATNGKAN